jgi:hypothetical protein
MNRNSKKFGRMARIFRSELWDCWEWRGFPWALLNIHQQDFAHNYIVRSVPRGQTINHAEFRAYQRREQRP